jgi:hypothetical protein
MICSHGNVSKIHYFKDTYIKHVINRDMKERTQTDRCLGVDISSNLKELGYGEC